MSVGDFSQSRVIAGLTDNSKRSQVPSLGFQVEGKSNNSDLIRTWHRSYLAISAYSRANSVAGSDECGLADGISIFRPKPLNL